MYRFSVYEPKLMSQIKLCGYRNRFFDFNHQNHGFSSQNRAQMDTRSSPTDRTKQCGLFSKYTSASGQFELQPNLSSSFKTLHNRKCLLA